MQLLLRNIVLWWKKSVLRFCNKKITKESPSPLMTMYNNGSFFFFFFSALGTDFHSQNCSWWQAGNGCLGIFSPIGSGYHCLQSILNFLSNFEETQLLLKKGQPLIDILFLKLIYLYRFPFLAVNLEKQRPPQKKYHPRLSLIQLYIPNCKSISVVVDKT